MPDVLESTSLSPLLSPYLHGGVQNETNEILKLEITGRKALAHCRVSSTFSSPTMKGTHLSFFNASLLVSQVTMAHSLYIEGYREKKVEVLMNDFSVTCTNLLPDLDNIMVSTDIYARYVTTSSREQPRVFHRIRFQICDEWFGDRGLCFYLPPERHD